eukprot:1569617-Heterocapsa_arctica.AAC.1
MFPGGRRLDCMFYVSRAAGHSGDNAEVDVSAIAAEDNVVPALADAGVHVQREEPGSGGVH